MPVTTGWEGMPFGAWRVAAAAALLLAGSAGGAGAQGSEGSGAGAGGAVFVASPGAGHLAPSEEGDGDEELLFAGGPREPGVLSAEGTMIGAGAKVAESVAEGDAVAALVASVTAGAEATEPVVEDAASGGEPREGSRSLLRSLGEILGLSRDE